METNVASLGTSLPVLFVLSLALVLMIRRRGRNGKAGGAGVFLALIGLITPLEYAPSAADGWIAFAIGLAGVAILAWNLERSQRDE